MRIPAHAAVTHPVLRVAAILLSAAMCPSALGGETDTAEPATDRIGKTQAAVKQDYSQKLICKRETVTGSNLRKKVCRTQARIDADKQASDQLMHDINMHAGKAGPPQ
jgi:hypothetical protein